MFSEDFVDQVAHEALHNTSESMRLHVTRDCKSRLVVEFIGKAGVGKSTLCRGVAMAIRSKNGRGQDWGEIQVVDNLQTCRLRELNPWRVARLAVTARRISHAMTIRFGQRYGFCYWLARLLRMDMHYRKRYPASLTLVLSDEGVLQILRKAPGAAIPDLLSGIRLPDIVIEVCAPWRDVYWRRFRRARVPGRHKILTDEKRKHGAAKMARLFIQSCSEAETHRFLSVWNNLYCSPQLGESELQLIVEAAVDRPRKLRRKPELRELRQALEARGVEWLQIQNPIGQPMEEAIHQIVAILTVRCAARGAIKTADQNLPC